MATVITPLFSKWGDNDHDDDDDDDDDDDRIAKGRSYQRNINTMAEYVLNGIESFSQKNK
jgi:hypothetical protein